MEKQKQGAESTAAKAQCIVPLLYNMLDYSSALQGSRPQAFFGGGGG